MEERKLTPGEQYLLLRGQIAEITMQIDAAMNRKSELMAFEKQLMAQHSEPQEKEEPETEPELQEPPKREEVLPPKATPQPQNIPLPTSDKKKPVKKWY
jgi:hypothetical protein